MSRATSKSRARRTPLVVDAFDIAHWLEHDESLAWQARVERDRAALHRSKRRSRNKLTRVRAWWNEVERPASTIGPGFEIARFFRYLDRIMLTLGSASGIGLALAVLHYDGSEPLNVLVVLAWLVLLPLALLLVSVVLIMLSPARLGRALSVAGLLGSMLRRRSPLLDDFFQRALNDAARGRLLAARLMQTSQLAGLGFAFASLAVAVLKISFSDLAFGWSTTLSVESDTTGTLVAVIAWPWAEWLPRAVPSAELIEQSRYFRLQHNASTLEAAALTAWWQFLALCLVCYGLVPRALAWFAARWLSVMAARRLLLAQPQVRALLDRLDTHVVSATAPDAADPQPSVDRTASTFNGEQTAALAVLWNGVAAPAGYAGTITAGGDNSLDEDIAALAGMPPASTARVDVITKAWEPPMLDLHDYLRALREHLGTRASIVVRPLDEAGGAPNERDRTIWRRAMARLGEAGIYVQ